MHTIARLLLIVAVLAGLYSIVLVVYLGWPATGWMVSLLGLARYGRKSLRGLKRLNSHGSARFADEHDLRRAGMLNARSGLILGRMP